MIKLISNILLNKAVINMAVGIDKQAQCTKQTFIQYNTVVHVYLCKCNQLLIVSND